MAVLPRRASPGHGTPEHDQAGAAPGWTAGRVLAAVAGSVLAIVSLLPLAGAGAAVWADQTQRQDGYLTSRTVTYTSSGYAVASDPVSLSGWRLWLASFAGDVRIRATATGPGKAVFVGIAPAPAARGYLSGVAYTSVSSFGSQATVNVPGSAVPRPPGTAAIWTVRAAGTGTQTLKWPVRGGTWMVVAMNADGAPGVGVRADVGAAFPALPSLAAELTVVSILLMIPALALIVAPVRMASGGSGGFGGSGGSGGSAGSASGVTP